MQTNTVSEVERNYTETVKEYSVEIPNSELVVYGRVTKITNSDQIVYAGDFSHYFLTGKGAIEYFRDGDDNITNPDFEQANLQVIQYLEDFTIEFGKAKKNKFYKR